VAGLFDREDTLELVRMVEDMPSLPDRFFRIRQIIESEESGSGELAKIIGTDQGTASMVLKVANSVYYSPTGKPVGQLTRAIARLGYKETANIAMTMSLFYGFALPAGIQNVRTFWAHAYAVAVLSRKMAIALQLDGEEIFVAGLLHDTGKAILGLRVDLSYFEGAMDVLQGVPLLKAEQEYFGLDHAEAGAEILGLWHFPASIQKAIEKHHQPDTGFLPARIISLADREAHKYLPDVSDIDRVEAILKERFPGGVVALLQSEGMLD